MIGNPVYIAHENDIFMEHYTIDYGATTLCGIRWEDLPDNIFTNPDGTTFTEQGDKPMYADHDRDDVIKCLKCEVRSRIFREGIYNE